MEHGDALASFRHDVGPFEKTRPILESLLRRECREPRRRARVWLVALGLASVVLAGLFLGRREAAESRAEAQRRAYARAFAAEPGFVVHAVESTAEGHRIAGLRDPLARTPSEVFRSHGLPAAQVRFVPFDSLDPRLARQRAARLLRPPPGVRLTLGPDGTLHASGTAPRSWIERARLLATVPVGVLRYDDGGLVEDTEALRRAVAELERLEVRFSARSAEASGDAVALTESRARRVLALASDAGATACIDVRGHTARVGGVRRSTALSRARARNVTAALIARGIPPERLIARGAGTRTGVPAPRARSVTFDVELRETGSDCGAA